jgi:hypothetical protein
VILRGNEERKRERERERERERGRGGRDSAGEFAKIIAIFLDRSIDIY